MLYLPSLVCPHTHIFVITVFYYYCYHYYYYYYCYSDTPLSLIWFCLSCIYVFLFLFPHLCMLFHTVFFWLLLNIRFQLFSHTHAHTNHIQTDTYFDFTNLSKTPPPLSSKPPRFKRQNRSIVYRLLFVLTFCFPIQPFEFSFPFPCVSVCFHRFFHRISVFFFQNFSFCLCVFCFRSTEKRKRTNASFQPFLWNFPFPTKNCFQKPIQISLFVDYWFSVFGFTCRLNVQAWWRAVMCIFFR